jgi:hypothetical protein
MLVSVLGNAEVKFSGFQILLKAPTAACCRATRGELTSSSAQPDRRHWNEAAYNRAAFSFAAAGATERWE